MKVNFELVLFACDLIMIVMICGAVFLTLARKLLNNTKYDDILENLALLCMLITLIVVWIRTIASVIQALMADYAAADPTMQHVVPYLLAFLFGTVFLAIAYQVAPKISWIDADVVKPWIFVLQSSASVFFRVGIAATLIVRACIRGGL